MLNMPILRWGQPYTSMDVDDLVHFQNGEPIAKVSRANGGMIQRDMRRAQRAKRVLKLRVERRRAPQRARAGLDSRVDVWQRCGQLVPGDFLGSGGWRGRGTAGCRPAVPAGAGSPCSRRSSGTR